MACAPNEIVRWSDVRELMDKAIDELAVYLTVKDVVNDPRDDWSSPFHQSDVVHAGFAYKFFLNAGSIQSHFAMNDLCSAASDLFEWPEGLEELANSGRLRFVHEGGTCWCCTVFDVFDGGGISLREPAEATRKGCYQTLYVPQVGASLGYDQNIIPAAYAAYYDALLTWPSACEYGPRCEPEKDDRWLCAYNKGAADNPPGLVGASRWMDGFFTWNIDGADFGYLWDTLAAISAASCGAEANKFYKNGDNSQFMTAGDPVSMADILYTLQQEGDSNSTLAGGITNAYSGLPWNQPTNDGENCEGNGPKVYCATLQHLQAIIDKMYDLIPANVKVDPSCAITLRYVDENRCEDDAFNVYIKRADGSYRWLFLLDMVSTPAGCCVTDPEGNPCPQTEHTYTISLQDGDIDGCGRLTIKLEFDHANCCSTLAVFYVSGPNGSIPSQSFGPDGLEQSFNVLELCNPAP